MTTYNETGLHYGTPVRGVFPLLSFSSSSFHCGGHSLECYKATWRLRAPTSSEASINQSIDQRIVTETMIGRQAAASDVQLQLLTKNIRD